VTLNIRPRLSCSQELRTNFAAGAFFFNGSEVVEAAVDGAEEGVAASGFLGAGVLGTALGLGACGEDSEGTCDADVDGAGFTADPGSDVVELDVLGFWSFAKRFRRIWTNMRVSIKCQVPHIKQIPSRHPL